jgi:asparagine synthase (glutamine-hydrolysing)
MCGIWAILGKLAQQKDVKDYLKKLEARGPEYTACVDVSAPSAEGSLPGMMGGLDATQLLLGFTRLAINGLTPAGHQPFTTSTTYTACNGELYNYKELAKRWNIALDEGTSDCAILPPLIQRLPLKDVCRTLDGVFAFIHVDVQKQQVIVAKDPYGVRPLFQATYPDNSLVWSSELKGLPDGYTTVAHFPPGTYRVFDLGTGRLIEAYRYHTIPHVKLAAFQNHQFAKQALRESLLSAVKKRLLSDRPIGALLSGGVDSSLIAAIAARELAKDGKQLHTFSIGMPGSTDLVFAEKVAKHINSIHHPVIVTPETFLEAIPKVIYDAETYDITSVRASVGNWLIGKYIKETTDIKVVFNGDGSDEIGGGYLYFYNAPSNEEFEAESERLLKEIHMFDVLRSDRSVAAHGLEARTPFLDKNVVATWRAIATGLRRPIHGETDRMEKQLLRDAFLEDNYLPFDVLYRKKEAFSDGVSSKEDSWYKRCSEYAKKEGLDLETIKRQTVLWHNPPKTEEAYMYRRIFESHYSWIAAKTIPYMWMPRWVANASDPSARTLASLY